MPAVARSGSGRRCLVCRGTRPCESHWAWASFSAEFSVSCRCLDSGCFRLDCWCSPSICRWSGAGAGLSWCAGNDGTARESSAKAPRHEARQKRRMRGNEWRPRPESNRGARICRTLSAIEIYRLLACMLRLCCIHESRALAASANSPPSSALGNRCP
jgi:hypothetical protein